MRIVVALGGNALLRRGEPMTVGAQRVNIREAARAIAPLAAAHELVITHGNGPQVGLLALQAAAYQDSSADAGTPLDVLGAESEGMIGYVIEQELGNVLPFEQPIATILTMVEVDPADPAFASPSKPIGPVYDEGTARKLADERGWDVAQDGEHWRRVVPSPSPKRIFELQPIRWLLEQGTIVVCAGGGGIPTMYLPDGTLTGAEVVIDKDRATALLAREVEADLLVLATDVPGVYTDWGQPGERLLRTTTCEELEQLDLPPGSMGSKVDAAIDFTRGTGNRTAVGALADIEKLVDGSAGTQVES